MVNEVILGKEYIFVPVEADPALEFYHGRTVVPLSGPFFEQEGYVVNLDGPLYVLREELIDPEGGE